LPSKSCACTASRYFQQGRAGSRRTGKHSLESAATHAQTKEQLNEDVDPFRGRIFVHALLISQNNHHGDINSSCICVPDVVWMKWRHQHRANFSPVKEVIRDLEAFLQKVR
jgi:hypothetical protein